MGWCEKGRPTEDTARVVEARGRDIAWICQAVAARRRTRGAVLPGYLCEVCLDAPAVRLVPAPEGGEMGICEACGIPEDAEEERP